MRRDGQPVETSTVETKSLLFHDLVHYALETSAGLQDGFYGLLAQGKSFTDLNDPEMPYAPGTQISEIEKIVGPLQTALKGEVDPARFVATLREMMLSANESLPLWVSEDVVSRSAKRMRALWGEWKATPFGQTITLEWPPS